MYLINMMIASFFASLGFGVMFNIRGRKLILAGIAGSIGGAQYRNKHNPIPGYMKNII